MTDFPDKFKLNDSEAALVPIQLLDDTRHLLQAERDGL
jgi:hypothetical protein